ncbi:MAG: CopD family protein [Anaerolineae bacterium]|nr:CopD family protein [Anaerolineae bacterium]
MLPSTLALSLFFHLLATVVWIGGLVVTVILVYPAVARTLKDNPGLYRLLSRLRTRFAPLSYLSLTTLIVTGLFQMTADPAYEGFMSFNNTWSQVMLVKHLAIIGMVIVGGVLQWLVVPELERTSLLVERGKGDAATWERLRRREIRLTWASVSLGIAVLGLSAWAGAL